MKFLATADNNSISPFAYQHNKLILITTTTTANNDNSSAIFRVTTLRTENKQLSYPQRKCTSNVAIFTVQMAFQYETVQAWHHERDRYSVCKVAPSVESLYKTPSSTCSRDSVAVDSFPPVFNTLVRGEPLNTGPRNLASRN